MDRLQCLGVTVVIGFAKAVELRQFNPAKDFDLDRSQWQKVQLIVGKYSR